MSTYTPYDPTHETYTSPPITIVLTVTLLVFLFIGFISIYFFRCFMQNIINSLQLRNGTPENLVGTAAATTATNPGLDPSLIQAFPTFAYSTVKGFRHEKFGLECAICLAEFEHESMLRLLTVCYHVFHQECIDLWLESNKTCPVCRRNLDLPGNPLEKFPVMHDISENESIVLEDAISIYIKEDDNDNDNENEQGRRERDDGQGGEGAGDVSIKENETWEDHQKLEKFSRSHSTGHSILRIKELEDDDKHTLRLPDHVKIKLFRGHHNNWTGSCIPFGDYSSHMATNQARINGVSGEVAECSSGGDMDKV